MMVDAYHLPFRYRVWKKETAERVAIWIAWRLPRSVALWAFIRVSAATGEPPNQSYVRIHKA